MSFCLAIISPRGRGGGGRLSYKIDGGGHRKLRKEPQKVPDTRFVGVVYINFFPLRGTSSFWKVVPVSIFFCLNTLITLTVAIFDSNTLTGSKQWIWTPKMYNDHSVTFLWEYLHPPFPGKDDWNMQHANTQQ